MSKLSELKIDTIMKNNCLILDGIERKEKTSATVSLLMQNGIKYIHTTSTNKLKADIRIYYIPDPSNPTVKEEKKRTSYTGISSL